jgi:hypothetical protein
MRSTTLPPHQQQSKWKESESKTKTQLVKIQSDKNVWPEIILRTAPLSGSRDGLFFGQKSLGLITNGRMDAFLPLHGNYLQPQPTVSAFSTDCT